MILAMLRAAAHRLWRRVFYPWDEAPPVSGPPTKTAKELEPTNGEAPRKLADWTLSFALDELQRCYDSLGPRIAPSDVRAALPIAGCVSDSVDATVRLLRSRIETLEVENRLLRSEVDYDAER